MERVLSQATMKNAHQMSAGNQVRIKCGSMFDGYEGAVIEFPTAERLVRFAITIFGNQVELVLRQDQLEIAATQS